MKIKNVNFRILILTNVSFLFFSAVEYLFILTSDPFGAARDFSRVLPQD
jgi:hypothetical protein